MKTKFNGLKVKELSTLEKSSIVGGVNQRLDGREGRDSRIDGREGRDSRLDGREGRDSKK